MNELKSVMRQMGILHDDFFELVMLLSVYIEKEDVPIKLRHLNESVLQAKVAMGNLEEMLRGCENAHLNRATDRWIFGEGCLLEDEDD